MFKRVVVIAMFAAAFGNANSVQANLIVNGSFEEPDVPTHGVAFFPAIPGWQTTIGLVVEIQDNIAGSPFDGDQFVELDAHSNGGIGQNIATVPGAEYTLSFAYSPRPGVSELSNPVEVWWNGALLESITASGIGNADTDWQVFTYPVISVGTLSSVEFRAAGTNESLGGYIDDVRLIPVVIPPPVGTATLLKARPSDFTVDTEIVALVVGDPGTPIPNIEVLESAACIDGELQGTGGEDPISFGIIDSGGTLDGNGESYVLGVLAGEPGTYVAARLINDEETAAGATSECIVFGPDNDSWTRPVVIPLAGPDGEAKKGSAESYIDKNGQSRWFRFAIKPGARSLITLSGLPDGIGDLTDLPADYDLAVFRDIFQAFSDLAGDNDVEGLNQLGAEFAPQAFSPQAFSPQAFSPQAFSPQAFSPQAFSPQAFSPQAFSPQAFSPQAFSPQAFSPQAFSPQAFSPQAFSPQAFSPQAFSPQAFSPQAFSPEAFASAQIRSLIAVAYQTGPGQEVLLADTWNNTGDFYVRVSGKNGAFDVETPFQLSVELDAGLCNDVGELLIPPTYMGSSGAYESLILWDEMQMAGAGYSPAEIELLRAKLDELSAAVDGVIVNLGDLTFPDVQALHGQAKGSSGSSCPYAANLTAEEIKRIVDAYRLANESTLKYIVLVGDDRQIPFFRYPDQALLGPEQDYDPPMADGTQSQASLRLNYVLGQDEYGAKIVTVLKDNDFPIPDLAVGRLVETPAEIIRVIDAYLATADGDGDGFPDGVIATPNRTLVTGYDFLQDTADAVQFHLEEGTQGGPLAPINRSLITNADVSPNEVSVTLGDGGSWTADQLQFELDMGADIMFLAGHFSANSTLAADYQSTLIVNDLDMSLVDLTNTLVFSSGCHSGYNIVNEEAVDGITLQLDWAQVFARKGATLIAGTGYQYGDTDFIEYSERLYVEFTKELRRNSDGLGGTQPVRIGEALVRAKQRYLADTPDLIGLHRKSLLISTLFGLPMFGVELPGVPLDEQPTDTVIPIDLPTQVPPTPGEVLGLQTAPLQPGSTGDPLLLQSETVTLEVVPEGPISDPPPPPDTVVATYLVGPDGVQTRPGAPALPLISRNVTAPGKSLRGVGFRGGEWFEQRVVPLTGAPTTELRGVHGLFSSLVYFPMKLASINYFGAIAGDIGTSVHITPAQHRVDNIGDPDAILRQFNSLDFELFYSSYTSSTEVAPDVIVSPALASPPSLSGVRAVTEDVTGDDVDDDVVFLVHVVGDPAAGIQKAWVTYTEGAGTFGATNQWVSLDLIQDPVDSTLWSGRLAGGVDLFERLDYVVQAVNGVGLVTLEDNFGDFYHISGRAGEVNEQGVSDTLVASQLELTAPPVGSTGAFRGEVSATAQLTDADGTGVVGARVIFTIGASSLSATTDSVGVAAVTLPLNSLPGVYNLTADFAGDSELELLASTDSVEFEILKADTNLELMFGEQQVNVENVSSGVTARLTDATEAVLPEQTVYFTVFNGPDGDITIPVITDNTGVAALGDLMLPPASYRIDVQYLGALPTGVTLEDPVYNPSSDTDTLDLIGGENCPTTSVKGKVALSGFCYLVHLIDGKVSITNGTLVVGSTTLIADGGEVIETTGVIDHKIDQYGDGSVLIFESASVRGNISESGAGGIAIYGDVGGNLNETGPGGIEIMAPAVVDGVVKEYDDGDLIVGGSVQGAGDSIENTTEDFTTNATVLGNVFEYGGGNLVITPIGFVDGNAFESGEGSAIVDPASITGHVEQD